MAAEKILASSREQNDALQAAVSITNGHAASGDANEDAKKAAKQAMIAAAIERAKAAKAATVASGNAPKNVVDADEAVKKEIAEIEARRQAVGLTDNQALTEMPVVAATADADKQAKIAAAIAKAKAAKAAADAAKLNMNNNEINND